MVREGLAEVMAFELSFAPRGGSGAEIRGGSGRGRNLGRIGNDCKGPVAGMNFGCLRSLFLEAAELSSTKRSDPVRRDHGGAGKELGSYSKLDASHWRFRVAQ